MQHMLNMCLSGMSVSEVCRALRCVLQLKLSSEECRTSLRLWELFASSYQFLPVLSLPV